MKRRMICLVLILSLLLMGCGQTDPEGPDNTREFTDSLGRTVTIPAEITKIGDLMEIVKLGVMSAPSLMVDGKLLVAGKVAGQKEIVKLLKKHTGR